MTRLIRRILIVDDKQENRLRYARLVLGGSPDGTADRSGPILPMVSVANGRDEALAALVEAREAGSPFHVLVTDLFMPEATAGISLIRELRSENFHPADLEVVLVSTHRDAQACLAEIDIAAEVWGGAKNGLKRVFRERPRAVVPAGEQPMSDAADMTRRDDDEFLENVWKGIWDRIDESFRAAALVVGERTSRDNERASEFSQDPRTHALVAELLEGPARTNVAIVLEGESGTGKGHLARLVHERSARADRQFVTLNCAAIPSDLFESELYGHEKGAFTGAIKTRKGLIEAADGGTLFLDEIAQLELRHQAKLLRVLDTGGYRRVGSDEERSANVRLLAATNIPLSDAVAAGRFREDLYYRISVVSMTLPPLRERRDDILPLVFHYWNAEQRREGTPARPETWSEEALNFMVAQSWKGNVRELINFIVRLKTTKPEGNAVTLADLQKVVRDARLGLLIEPRLRTFTQRAKHFMILRALARVRNLSPHPTVTDVVDSIVGSPDVILFPGSGDSRWGKAQSAVYEHRDECEICRALILVDSAPVGAAQRKGVLGAGMHRKVMSGTTGRRHIDEPGDPDLP